MYQLKRFLTDWLGQTEKCACVAHLDLILHLPAHTISQRFILQFLKDLFRNIRRTHFAPSVLTTRAHLKIILTLIREALRHPMFSLEVHGASKLSYRDGDALAAHQRLTTDEDNPFLALQDGKAYASHRRLKLMLMISHFRYRWLMHCVCEVGERCTRYRFLTAAAHDPSLSVPVSDVTFVLEGGRVFSMSAPDSMRSVFPSASC